MVSTFFGGIKLVDDNRNDHYRNLQLLILVSEYFHNSLVVVVLSTIRKRPPTMELFSFLTDKLFSTDDKIAYTKFRKFYLLIRNSEDNA